jgi:hypothetical protein
VGLLHCRPGVTVVATASSKPTKKLTPQQRAIEKKRVRLRKLRALGIERWGWATVDPDACDWEKKGEHFDNLSDDEWADVWKRVRSALRERPLVDETHIRELVDDAAHSSGWFADFGGEITFSRADCRRSANTTRRFLQKVQEFRNELAKFFGAPPDDHEDPYDSWEEHRPLVPRLNHLADFLERNIVQDEKWASIAEKTSNAAQPELDVWRARLVLIWENDCGLPVKNTKLLRGFLLDALQPYMSRTKLTDTTAKHFIKRWLAGEVQKPGLSLLQIRGDK